MACGSDGQPRLKQDPDSEDQGRNNQQIHGGFSSCPIPGLGEELAPVSASEAGGFAVGQGRHQVKRPYMSALSEMNGRPLHVRQQQFEKERQYRDMLREQIEENRRRKEAEKAKLEDEKRRELEEIRSLHDTAGPRRQQHAEFQQSPDHPMPLSARWPTTTRERFALATPTCNGDHVTPAHDPFLATPSHEPRSKESGEYETHHGRPRTQLRNCRKSPVQMGLDEGRSLYRESHGSGGGSCSGSAAVTSTEKSRYCSSLASYPVQSGVQGDETPRASRALTNSPPAFDGQTPNADSVSRSDFDELTSLCRELLLEQKELRRRLEEREKTPERPGEDSKHGQVRERQRQEPACMGGSPRRLLTSQRASSTGTIDERRRRRTRPSPGLSFRTRAERDGLCGDSTVKPTVAFGSRAPRFKQSQVDEALPGRDASSQVTRISHRYSRTGASERAHGPVDKVAQGRGYLDGRGATSSRSTSWREGDRQSWCQSETFRDGVDHRRARCEGRGVIKNRQELVQDGTHHDLLGKIADAKLPVASSSGRTSRGEHELSDELGGESKFLGGGTC